MSRDASGTSLYGSCSVALEVYLGRQLRLSVEVLNVDASASSLSSVNRASAWFAVTIIGW